MAREQLQTKYDFEICEDLVALKDVLNTVSQLVGFNLINIIPQLQLGNTIGYAIIYTHKVAVRVEGD